LHCHLKPPVPSIALGYSHEAGWADLYSINLPIISTKSAGRCMAELLIIPHIVFDQFFFRRSRVNA